MIGDPEALDTGHVPTAEPQQDNDPTPSPEAAELPDAADGQWTALLDYLRVTRSFDFHGYKRTSLIRRIRKRMTQIGISSVARYRDWLERHPDEFTVLFNTTLINVTSFFRDAAAWETLRETAIRPLLAQKEPGSPIRIWSAGCATGEEAYSIAILLAEELGDEPFRHRVKVYATDIDEEALTEARHAVYRERQLQGVAPALLAKYCVSLDGRYTFRRDFRRQVIFGRHDLLQDAPISRVDLLLCRNVLMYFNADAQAKVLSRFHFALPEGGYLFLGRAETMTVRAAAFRVIDLKCRIFVKLPSDERRGDARRRGA